MACFPISLKHVLLVRYWAVRCFSIEYAFTEIVEPGFKNQQLTQMQITLQTGQAWQLFAVIWNPVVNFKMSFSWLNAEFSVGIAGGVKICLQTSVRSWFVFFHSALFLISMPTVNCFQFSSVSFCHVPSFFPCLQHVLTFRCNMFVLLHGAQRGG